MKVLTCVCWVGVGDGGYAAAREWRRVQEERPSCSTSGGQFDESGRAVVAVFGEAEESAAAAAEVDERMRRWEVKSESLLQVRQLD